MRVRAEQPRGDVQSQLSCEQVTVVGWICSHYLTAADFRWRTLTTCAMSTRIWPSYKRPGHGGFRANVFKTRRFVRGTGLYKTIVGRSCGEEGETSSL